MLHRNRKLRAVLNILAFDSHKQAATCLSESVPLLQPKCGDRVRKNLALSFPSDQVATSRNQQIDLLMKDLSEFKKRTSLVHDFTKH